MVRELVRQGVPKQRIAERLGCSRTTVYRLAALDRPPTYERRSTGSQLDPFKDAVAAMLDEDARVPATVIRQRLQQDGYGGGITILEGLPARAAAALPPPRLPAHRLCAG